MRRFAALPERKPLTKYTQKPTRPGSPEIVFTIAAGVLMANPPGARIVCAWENDRNLSRVTLHNADTSEVVCTFLVEPPPDEDGRTITTETMELAAAVYWSWWRGSSLPIADTYELDRAVQGEIARALGELIQAIVIASPRGMWPHGDRVFRRASTTGLRTFARILHTAMGGRIPDEVP